MFSFPEALQVMWCSRSLPRIPSLLLCLKLRGMELNATWPRYGWLRPKVCMLRLYLFDVTIPIQAQQLSLYPGSLSYYVGGFALKA